MLHHILLFEKESISGSTLKIIALVCMLFDHVGAALMEPYVISDGASDEFLIVYTVFRFLIGRAAFPIFCFLLVEGFCHTSNVGRYAIRLAAFAVLSEIPFNLALIGPALELSHQNVYFTLLLGVLAMAGYQEVEKRIANDKEQIGWKLIIMGFTMLTADLARTDYGSVGILTISVLYFLKAKREKQLLGGAASIAAGSLVIQGNIGELTAPIGFAICRMYNGKRGLSLKYLFYIFYPAHLLLLNLVKEGIIT